MFQNRRTVFLFICSVVFVQALYYIVTLQTKENKKRRSNVQLVLSNQASDNQKYTQHDTINLTFIHDTSSSTEPTRELLNLTNGSSLLPINFSRFDLATYNSLPLCNFSISHNDSSIYKVNVVTTVYSLDVVEQHHGTDLNLGGHWFPSTCQAEQRLAIIICYRNRESHLKLFLNNIHPFLKKQQLDYTIFIVNQHGADQFNRAALFNVGYIEAMKLYPYTCFIFHDVDLLPEDLRNLYRCGERPRHMSVAVDKFNYRLLYSTLFGGVTAFSISDFIGANGYPTVYWGWGGEDDDMYLRVVRKLKKSITRYPVEIARYKMIRTFNHTSGKANPHRHTILYSKYKYEHDGINTTKYTLNSIVFNKLFTFINVTLTEETFEQIRSRLNIRLRQKKIKNPQKMKA